MLKSGGDPYRMYRTLTDGFGQMAAQTWMVPRQKYDVIHYIREAYLKPHNPSWYTRVDRAYLDQLPKGTSRGPAPVEIEPWVTMDYGPSLMATYEVGRDGSNFAYKGIAVRLDRGQGGVSRGQAWVVYDHDTLRLAAAWTGPGFHRLERDQLQRPPPGPSSDRRQGPGRQPEWTWLGKPGRPKFRRRPPPRTGWQILRPLAAPLGALQGALPSRRPGDPRLHRRNDRCPGDARPRDRPGAPRQSDLHAHSGDRPVVR